MQLRRLHGWKKTIFHWYCHAIFNFPWTVLLLTAAVGLCLSTVGIYFHYDALDFDPTMGFENRHDSLSNARLALTLLPDQLADWNTLFKNQKVKRDASNIEAQTDQESDFQLRTMDMDAIAESTSPVIPADDTVESSGNAIDVDNATEAFTINYDDYGQDFEPSLSDMQSDWCAQLMAAGDNGPLQYSYLTYFSKIVFSSASFEQLFTVSAFRRLCRIDAILEELRNETGYQVSAMLPFSLNLAYYSTCVNLSTPNTCDAINQYDIDHLASVFLSCRANSSSSAACSTPLLTQLQEYILPGQSTRDSPYHTAVILKLTLSRGGDDAFPFYTALLDRLEEEFDDDELRLTGAYFNTQQRQFLKSLQGDLMLCGVSAGLVSLTLLLYSRRLLFTLAVTATVFLSVGTGYFVYTVIFSLHFFPFLNLLALVLLVAIGADDAFLLSSYYNDMEKSQAASSVHIMHLGGSVEKEKQEMDGFRSLLRRSFAHTFLSMLVTSVTTFVAFLSNLMSDVIVLRCFGIFASIVIVLNYMSLLLMIAPAYYISLRREREEKKGRGVSKYRLLILDLQLKRERFSCLFARAVYRLRFLSLLLLACSMCFSLVALLLHPTIRLPDNNPMQLLRASHPFEWFAEETPALFHFDDRSPFRHSEVYLLGVNPVRASSSLNPRNRGRFSFDPRFHVDSYQDILRIQNMTNWANRRVEESVKHTSIFINGFVNWTRFHCESAAKGCCEEDEFAAGPCLIRFARSFSAPKLPSPSLSTPTDGPLFDKLGQLRGYYMQVPSSIPLSMRYTPIRQLFADIEETCVGLRTADWHVLCVSHSDVTRLRGLLTTLVPSTAQSVLLSIAACLCVIVLSTRRPLLSAVAIICISDVVLSTLACIVCMGWSINVVEATIIVLTIGLSFDFTLHFAVAHRHARGAGPEERIRNAQSSAGVASLGGATTLLACGAPLLFSGTSVFYEIGVILCIMGVLSLVVSSVIFPGILSLTQCGHRVSTVNVQNIHLAY